MSDCFCRVRLNVCTLYFISACLILFSSTLTASPGQAHLVIDANSGKTLSSRNANVLNHPASLTKMMVLYATFEALHSGRLNWRQNIVMSKRAARVIPFKLGVRAGNPLTVREAVMGMIVLSANDAAEAMCDHLSGKGRSCGAFLTRKARAIGMSRTTFTNGSGLPDKRQVTTARDMATLGLALQRDYPKEYALFATRSFKFRGRVIRGHNNLMYRYKGMDGIKTGFTNASGFNIVTAVNDSGRHLVGVVMGGKTARSRDKHMAALLDSAMRKATSGKATEIARLTRPHAVTLPKTNIPVPAPADRGTGVEVAASETTVSDVIQAYAPEAVMRSTWEVQIAATDSQDSALSLLLKAQPGIPGKFRHITPYTQEITRGEATLYRARFTGFDALSSALSACRQLRANEYECMVVRNGNG